MVLTRTMIILGVYFVILPMHEIRYFIHLTNIECKHDLCKYNAVSPLEVNYSLIEPTWIV